MEQSQLQSLLAVFDKQEGQLCAFFTMPSAERQQSLSALVHVANSQTDCSGRIIDLLMQHFATGNREQRLDIVGAIGKIEAPHVVLSFLLRLLRDEELPIRRAVVHALQGMGERAIPYLAVAFDHVPADEEEDRLQAEAVAIMGQLGNRGAHLVPYLLSALEHAGPQAKKAAADLAGELGQAAFGAILPLLEAYDRAAAKRGILSIEMPNPLEQSLVAALQKITGNNKAVIEEVSYIAMQHIKVTKTEDVDEDKEYLKEAAARLSISPIQPAPARIVVPLTVWNKDRAEPAVGGKERQPEGGKSIIPLQILPAPPPRLPRPREQTVSPEFRAAGVRRPPRVRERNTLSENNSLLSGSGKIGRAAFINNVLSLWGLILLATFTFAQNPHVPMYSICVLAGVYSLVCQTCKRLRDVGWPASYAVLMLLPPLTLVLLVLLLLTPGREEKAN